MSSPENQNLLGLNLAEHIGPNETGDNIPAKRAANYVWNSGTSQWERQTASSGGGDASAANQTTELTRLGDIAETAPATDTGSSGLNGRLQRIAQRLTSVIALLPGSLGQKARASSLAVTLSSEDITALTPVSAVTATLAAETTKVIGTVNQGTSPWVTNDPGIPDTLGQKARASSAGVTLSSEDITALTPPAAITGFSTTTKQSDGTQKTQVVDGSGNVISSTTNALDINIKSGNPTTITATQATGTNLHTVVDSGTITAVTAITNALPAGSALIGKVGIDQTTPGTTNRVDIGTINSVAPAFNTGARGATVQRVTIATDDIVPASQSGTWTVQPGNTANTTPWLVKDQRTATPAQTSVSVTNSNTSVLASTAGRLGATIWNEGTAICYLKLGATASTTSYSVQIASGGYYELPYNYTGAVDGITSASTAQLRITELT